MTSTASDTLRVAVLTISDRASVSTYDDRTGPALVELVAGALFAQVVEV